MKTLTTSEVDWIYAPPQDVNAKCFLLTIGRVASIGTWGNGQGLIAHYPMPKRDKEKERNLGLMGFKHG